MNPEIREKLKFEQEENNPYGRDEFERRPFAENIIKLLQSQADISPLAINGDWGTGKTEFAIKLKKMIEAALNEKNFNVIYVDAFRADHTNNPLMVLLAEIVKLLQKTEEVNTLQAFKDSIIPTLSALLTVFGQSAFSRIYQMPYEKVKETYDENVENQDKIKNHIETPFGDFTDHECRKILDEYVKLDEKINALRKALIVMIKNHPLLLIIDELDRCKPDFALAMLEILKHIFNVEGIQIILVTNIQQLEASIYHSYGQNLDAKRYLDKFIKFKINLPVYTKSDAHASVEYLENNLQNLYEKYHIDKNKQYDNGTTELLRELVENNNLSLRDTEKLVRNIEVFCILQPKAKVWPFPMFSLFIYLFNNDIVDDLKVGNFPIEKLNKILNIQTPTIFDDLPSKKFIHGMAFPNRVRGNAIGYIFNCLFTSSDIDHAWMGELLNYMTEEDYALLVQNKRTELLLSHIKTFNIT